MNKILVPTDFTVSSENALDVAAAVSRKTGWPVTLLNVIKSKDLMKSTLKAMQNEGGANKVLAEAKANLEKLRAKAKYEGVEISIELALKDNISLLTEEIAAYDARLIVMGTKTLDGYANEKRVGDNTRDLVKKANCPVLVVKKKIHKIEINSVVFTTNFDQAHKDILNNLADLFNALNTKVHLLCVSTPDNFVTTIKYKNRLNDMMGKSKINSWDSTLYNDKNKEEGILNFSKEYSADMLVMPTHGRRGLNLFLNGSIAENVLDHFDGLSMTIFQKD